MVGRKIKSIIVLIFVSISAFAQTNITTEDFKKYVWDFEANSQSIELKSNVPVIVDFYATWCGPCRMLTPELKALQKEYKDKLVVYKVDVDREPKMARFFGIKAMPTIYFIPTSGKATYAQGYMTKDQLKEIVDQFFFNIK
ncbi:MAG: thioredoxin [Paludibacteraceae bacterium]|nr:thioredoxin [Paludibacteraceae bacterium]